MNWNSNLLGEFILSIPGHRVALGKLKIKVSGFLLPRNEPKLANVGGELLNVA